MNYESKNVLCWSTIFVCMRSEWARTMIGKQDRILETRLINLDFIFTLHMPVSVTLRSWSRNRFWTISQSRLRVEKLGHRKKRHVGRWQEKNQQLEYYHGAWLQCLLLSYFFMPFHNGLSRRWLWWKDECWLLLSFTF